MRKKRISPPGIVGYARESHGILLPLPGRNAPLPAKFPGGQPIALGAEDDALGRFSRDDLPRRFSVLMTTKTGRHRRSPPRTGKRRSTVRSTASMSTSEGKRASGAPENPKRRSSEKREMEATGKAGRPFTGDGPQRREVDVVGSISAPVHSALFRVFPAFAWMAGRISARYAGHSPETPAATHGSILSTGIIFPLAAGIKRGIRRYAFNPLKTDSSRPLSRRLIFPEVQYSSSESHSFNVR